MAALKPVGLLPLAPPGRDCAVLAFARPPARPPGFSMRDRIELERWSPLAAAAGISRVRLESAEPTDLPGIGHFLLLYTGGEDWARWGVAPRDDGMVEVWSMGDGRALGCYATLAEALTTLVGD